MSASDLSFELRAPLANVNYHLVELAKQGLVALSHRRRVRGATEHFFRLPGDTAAGVEPAPASPARTD